MRGYEHSYSSLRLRSSAGSSDGLAAFNIRARAALSSSADAKKQLESHGGALAERRGTAYPGVAYTAWWVWPTAGWLNALQAGPSHQFTGQGSHEAFLYPLFNPLILPRFYA